MATKAKSGSNETGIERRPTAKGKTRYRGTVYSKATGKRSGPWGSHAEAKAWRTKALGEIAAGTAHRSDPQTLRAAWEDFIAGAKGGTVSSSSGRPFKPATLRGYERGWQKIDPELGAHRLTDIKRRNVQALLDDWAEQKMSPSTIRNSLDPLRTIYRRAIARDLVTVDPTDNLEVPADRDDEPMRFASKAEAAALIAAVPEDDRALWAAAMYAGLRRGELRALRWRDIDLTKGMIEMTRSWDDSEGEQTPKTAGSQRRVPIIPTLATLLRAHQTKTGRGGGDLVFGRAADKPFIPSTIRSRALRAWAKATPPLDPITLHQCRHTFASLMIDSGANAKALSVVMGHASITITFNRYGHLMPGGEAEVGKRLAAYLDGPT